MPTPVHTYTQQVYLNEGAKGSLLQLTVSGVGTESTGSGAAHKQDLATGLWTRAAANVASISGGFEGSAVYDPHLNRFYVVQSQFWSNQKLSYIRGSDMTWVDTPLMPFPPSGANYTRAFAFPERRLMLLHSSASQGGTAGLFALDLNNIAGGITALTTSGTIPTNQNQWVYHPRAGKFYQKPAVTGNTLNVLTPPSGTGKTGTWAFSTVTIAGSGLPSQTFGTAQHYTRLQYVPAIDMLAWIAAGTTQVAIVKV